MRDESKLWRWRVLSLCALTGCLVLYLRSPKLGTTPRGETCEVEEETTESERHDGARGASVGTVAPSQLLNVLEHAAGTRARCQALTRLSKSVRLPDAAVEQMASYTQPKFGMELRTCAIGALGEVRSAAAVPFLMELLEDPAQQISESGIRALAQHEDPEAREALVALGNGDNRLLAISAAVALVEAGAPEATPLITKLLASSVSQDRERLLYALGATHDPRALSVLLGYVATGSRGTQFAAVSALGELGGAGATRALLQLLTDRTELRPMVVSALARTGDSDARDALLAAAKDSDNRNTASAALQALSEFDGPDVRAMMLQAIEGTNPQSANVAMEYFASRGDTGAVPSLLTMARSGNQQTGYMALYALGRLGGTEAHAALVELANGNGRLADTALQALGNFPGGADEARALALGRARKGGSQLAGSLDMLSSDDSPEARALLISAAKSKDPRVSARALMFLGQRSDPESRATLEQALKAGGTTEERQAAMWALAQSGDPRAAKSLRGVLEQTDSPDRAQAVNALMQLGGAEAEQAILAASNDKDTSVVSSAAMALAQLGSPTALSKLEQVVGHADMGVSRQALLALASASPERAAPFVQAMSTSRDPEQRMSALSVAVQMNGPGSNEIIQAALRDSDQNVVRDALNSVGGDFYQTEAARETLLELTKNKALPEDLVQRANELLTGTPSGNSVEAMHVMAMPR